MFFSIVIHLLLAIHVIVSLLIILVVLMQRPKSEGLGAAFGGGMTENLFGAQTTNVLQTFTRWLGGIFFLLTLGLSVIYAKQAGSNTKSDIQKHLLAAPKPAIVQKTPAPPKPGAAPSLFPASSAVSPAHAPGTPAPSAASATKPAATPAPVAPEKQ